jgi:hypothetical protein
MYKESAHPGPFGCFRPHSAHYAEHSTGLRESIRTFLQPHTVFHLRNTVCDSTHGPARSWDGPSTSDRQLQWSTVRSATSRPSSLNDATTKPQPPPEFHTVGSHSGGISADARRTYPPWNPKSPVTPGSPRPHLFLDY